MNEKAINGYNEWKSQVLPEELANQLNGLTESEKEDCFYRDLEFGTGGLRGVLGVGTNRMNVITVRRATQGLCNYLSKTSLPQKVAVAYDSRIHSDDFAREAACVLAANGITAYLYPRLEPTPALSWEVRYFGCGAGICITASHNPAKYNGYKVYGADGCQITLEVADAILANINKLGYFGDVRSMDYTTALNEKKIILTDDNCIDDFVQTVYEQRIDKSLDMSKLKLVYTPLNGSGLECVKKLLNKLNVKNVTVVPEQEMPDGNFPTCPYPNPEIKEALELGLKLCEEQKADLLLGTDPDCDRCGTAAPDKNGVYHLISGNEMGVILLDYICKRRKELGTMPEEPVAVTTVVSTDMATAVTNKYGVKLVKVLTGFKFIGEQIGMLEAKGKVNDYIFGFEESYGYLSASHVRDKDAVNATLMICEAAAYYAAQGKTLYEVLQELYAEYGYYKNGLWSFTFEGASGMQKMADLMNGLRADCPAYIAQRKVVGVIDYSKGVNGLPKTNMLEFALESGAKLLIRPSGTEPKIKFYGSVVTDSLENSVSLLETLGEAAKQIVG